MKLNVNLALLLTAIFIGWGMAGQAVAEKATAPASPEKKANPAAPDANVDIVYYFMTTQRCSSCMKIEAFTKETVNTAYGEALKKGSMVWRMVDVDQPVNRHFIKEYQLYTKSVVLVKIRNGKEVGWKNLDKVWVLLGNKTAFQELATRKYT